MRKHSFYRIVGRILPASITLLLAFSAAVPAAAADGKIVIGEQFYPSADQPRRNIVICDASGGHYTNYVKRFLERFQTKSEHSIVDVASLPAGQKATFVYMGPETVPIDLRSCIDRSEDLKSDLAKKLLPERKKTPMEALLDSVAIRKLSHSSRTYEEGETSAIIAFCYNGQEQCASELTLDLFSIDGRFCQAHKCD